MKPVLSASRRTDLPACHYAWLQEVLRAGELMVPNPARPAQSYRVDLRPEKVHSIVLWSKDYQKVADDPGRLADYPLYFQYTINRYPRLLEPHAPDYAQTLRTLEKLRRSYGARQFNIRFDPLLFLGAEDAAARLSAFARLCADLEGLDFYGCRITTSALAAYGKVARRLQEAELTVQQEPELLLRVAREMAQTAATYGFSLYSCATPLLEKVPGIQAGVCIDGSLLEGLFGGKVSRAKDSGQRPACGCSASRDIGSYLQPCSMACLYCYARA
ncbi:DUF1848 family protein [Azotosporobacter soli]|uniref:DUF1848 family protein n=1 Tax=Azotosporobacter soli TaxID=3055040 RepID=UPI0031FEF44F